MGELYRVAIHHDNDCGYIEYDLDVKSITVYLSDALKRSAVEAYLGTRHVIPTAQNTLRDFKELFVVPNENQAALKLALTRLWEHTGVLVDWSRPVVLR